MWKKAELKSALKKAEAVAKTNKEETNQGATSNQVVQKASISPTPHQDSHRKLLQTPISFNTITARLVDVAEDLF